MWFEEFNKKALANPVVHDAVDYGVEILPAENLISGEFYWRIIGVHHLTGAENNGNHHLYLEALDENGIRVGKSFVGWTWEGRQLGQRADPAVLDKPRNEPYGNIGIFNATLSAWMLGSDINARDRSDMVVGVHYKHADEEMGNTWGHHSFYVVFQQTVVGEPEPPIPDPPSEKLINHYVLLSTEIGWATFILISKWLAEEMITAGFVVSEALLARRITGIGEFDDATKKVLLDSDSEFTLLSGKCALADEIDWMLKSEREAK